jgi:alpha-mannosidase
VRAPVELEVGGLKDDHVLLDDEGTPTPMQLVRSEATVTGWRRRVALIADLPPLGWRVYRFARGTAPPAPPSAEDWTVDELSAEGRRFHVRLDPERGCLASVFDKERELEVFSGPASRGVVIDDPSDTWAHGVVRFDRIIGELSGTSVARVEHGPVRTVLRAESAFGRSTVVQEVTVHHGIDRIDIKVTVDWRERRRILKLRFPVNLQFPKATFEVPFGHVDRATSGDEETGQAFVDLSGVVRATNALYGVTVANDGKHSFDVAGADLGITVARSAIFAHHDPYSPPEDGTYTYLDQGTSELRLTILPHDGGWEDAGAARLAWEVNQGPRAIFESAHDGPLPLRGSFLAASPENIVVSAVKPAEDRPDEAFIVRAYEAHRRATAARFVLERSGRAFEARFGASEIKTFRVPYDPALPVEEVDLLEWPPGRGPGAT